MQVTFRLHGWSKASFFGITSAAVHGAVALVFPSLPAAPLEAAAPVMVWMTTSDGSGSGGPDAIASSTPPAALEATKTRARARKHPSLSQRKPAENADASPSADAELPSPAAEAALAPESASASAPLAGEGSGGGEAGGKAKPTSGAASSGAAGANGAGAGAGIAHGPGLIAFGSPCKNYFPADAHADQGEVRIEVTVDEHGQARASNVLAEIPKGHGFGLAASACASHLHFNPAVDSGGAHVAGRAKLLLRFRRG